MSGTMYNPFDAAGYTVAFMTEMMEIVPNNWGRITQLGLFEPKPVPTTTVIVERRNQVLNLLPTRPRGSRGTRGNRETRDMRSFVIPHIPHDDEILPEAVQNIRDFGSPSGLMTLERVMSDKLVTLRRKHAYTHEYMRLQALKGVLKDGDGVTLYNWFTEFGITKKTVDFVLGTSTTDIDAKVSEVLRHMEVNLLGESMTGAMALVSPTFFDKLTGHARIREAYMHFTNRPGAEPLREDVRRRFVHKGLVFEEYNATFQFPDNTTEAAFTGATGIAFPRGTTETFYAHFGPANFIDTVNVAPEAETIVRQKMRDDWRGWDVFSESNPLPIVRRPGLLVELISSN